MQSFRDALDFCRLKDLGFSGFPFTWCNRRSGDHNVWVWLDRGVANVNWILRFHLPVSIILMLFILITNLCCYARIQNSNVSTAKVVHLDLKRCG